MATEIKKTEVALPSVDGFTAPMLRELTDALGISRNVLASDKQIRNAWRNLPTLLSSIPVEKRNEGIMRMCVAVASGLFDSALNYAWNAAIIELRAKVRLFGIHIIPQIINKEFNEKRLMEMQDSELLRLCLKLNLISEKGFFMLEQCRDIRNNFSAAHPAVGAVDEYEFINFLNRCARHALSEDQNTTAVDIKAFMSAITAGDFTQGQFDIWCERIEQTFDAQREAIFKMLHGIYCDPKQKEHARVTAINISDEFVPTFTPSITSELINQHQQYQANGKHSRLKASRTFFEKLGQLGMLSATEQHAIISTACKNLIRVHNQANNFYNERPFAERLADLATGNQIPETVRNEFVESVVTCAVGNSYGTAHNAEWYYQELIRGFSRAEIEIMLSLPEQNSVVANRIKHTQRCEDKFKEVVDLLKVESIPTKMKSIYEEWVED